jgi:hypothetical protein
MPEDQIAQPHSTERTTLIDAHEAAYRAALASIDSDVKQLVQQGQEMKALMLLTAQEGTICSVRAALRSLYQIVWVHQDALRLFGSQRFRQLKYELIPLISMEGLPGLEMEKLAKIGFQESHPLFRDASSLMLTETEYMIATLRTVIEPDFVPLAEREYTAGEQDKPDRYISAQVRIAVWRRDQGKCVECGSQERLEYDHIIPVAKGGSSTERNVQLLCEKCNRDKAAQVA